MQAFHYLYIWASQRGGKMQDIIKSTLQESRDVLERFMETPGNVNRIEDAGKLLIEVFKKGGKVISCGNGGSMCDAMHFAEELSGKFRNDRPALPAISISDASYISCVANDYGYDKVFSRFIEGMGTPGDILIAISTSGNSVNVNEAALAARNKGMKVIALTGKEGGKLAGLSDIEIRVPHAGYADRVQEIHIKVIHILIRLVEEGMGY